MPLATRSQFLSLLAESVNVLLEHTDEPAGFVEIRVHLRDGEPCDASVRLIEPTCAECAPWPCSLDRV